MGAAIQVAVPPPSRYTIRTNRDSATERSLVVTNMLTGEEVRLGYPNGYASFKTMNDRYIIWSFNCGCDDQGTYAYDLEQRTQQRFAAQNTNTAPHIDETWVSYLMAGDTRLHAYDLATNEAVVIEPELQLGAPPPSGSLPHELAALPRPEELMALQEQKMFWVDEHNRINMYDLATRQGQVLNIPAEAVAVPHRLSATGTVVVWQHAYRWWGYDLEYEELFAISKIPHGWENLAAGSFEAVQAKDGALHWLLRVNGQAFYFQAPIIRDE